MYPISSPEQRQESPDHGRVDCRVHDSISWIFPEEKRCLGWTIHGGGYQTTDRLLWLEVRNDDLPIGVSPLDCIRARANPAASTPVFLTSAYIANFSLRSVFRSGLSAQVLATVGLGNALRAGDQIDQPPYFGTINIACSLSQKLSDTALLEALSIISEAKCAALHDAGIRSPVSGLLASGTGTDCHAILCPSAGETAIYAGKHTGIGSVVGAATYEAIRDGIKNWQQWKLYQNKK